MPRNNYSFAFDCYGNTSQLLVAGRGVEVYDNSYTNKGTSFTDQERQELELEGVLPPAIRSLASQVENCRRLVAEKESDTEKFIYIRELFDRNVTLAHALIASDISSYLPIIYTPTVGLACRYYSSMFRKANGLHFYPGNIDQAEDILSRFRNRQIRVAVVTDNQGILGIGDQGAGGIAICLGKLMLYTLGAGIAPWHCLPVSLDVGTDNPELLADPDYLGWRQQRLRGQDYLDFVQRFARAFKTVFPQALCQWEDFSKQNAFATRDAYLHNLISFNDDIQGTGAVALAAILAAMRCKGESLSEQVFLVHGAGAGGVGIGEQLVVALVEEGLTVSAARARIYTVDSQGLVSNERPLEPYKKTLAKDSSSLPWCKGGGQMGLLEVIQNAKVTVLIGTSGQGGCFNREIVAAMQKNSARPVILPLSNPTEKAEALPADILAWTSGRALVATGSPFVPVNRDGQEVRIGQCNNVFIFPGVGLGVLASGAREVLPEFFTAAAKAVAAQMSPAELRQGVLLPEVGRLQEICLQVALAVGKAAIAAGVSAPCAFSEFQHDNDPERLAELIAKMRWHPDYLPMVAR